MNDLDNLLRVRETEVKSAAEVLARAFQDEALYAHIIADAEERKRILPFLFQFRIRYGALYGEVYAVSPRLEGVAVWISSENVHMTRWRILRAGGFYLYHQAGRKVISRLNSIEDYVSAIRRRWIDSPHWHLSPIAVDPCYQGKGYARRLLKAMFARLDKEKLPCFLETQSEKNVKIYQRYGFRVVEKGAIPDTEIPHWAMLRESEQP